MNIAVGSDEAGYSLKQIIKEYVEQLGHQVLDYGVFSEEPVLYPDIAYAVATAVAAGKHERAILICGTGIGMAITANKIPGIRAAVCHDVYSAERSRMSNNCQIMTLGSRVVGVELAKELVGIWLKSEYQGGRSAPKVDRICEIEKEFSR